MCSITEHSAAGHLSLAATDCDAFLVINQQSLSTVVARSPVVWRTSPGERGASSEVHSCGLFLRKLLLCADGARSAVGYSDVTS